MFYYNQNRVTPNDQTKDNNISQFTNSNSQMNNSQTEVKQQTNVNGLTKQGVEALNSNEFETLQNARLDLVGELQAIIQYDHHIHELNPPQAAKATWEDIRDEELVHVGELLALHPINNL